MKRILLLFLAVALLLPCLAACQRDLTVLPPRETWPQEPEKTEKPTEKETEEMKKPENFDDHGNITFDGWSDYVIVIGKTCELAEKTAASELRNYIKKMSGAFLEIVTDDTPKAEKELVVGNTADVCDGTQVFYRESTPTDLGSHQLA
jgi:hypothetical protein